MPGRDVDPGVWNEGVSLSNGHPVWCKGRLRETIERSSAAMLGLKKGVIQWKSKGKSD